MIGQRYWRLTILASATRGGKRAWLCRCDCGVVKTIATHNFGKTRSCGCLRNEHPRRNSRHTHGMSGTVEHQTWAGMKQRCFNKKCAGYRLYGGRGITVCERWMKFENFLEDMGPRPDGYSIDRINVNGNYEPSNCRWVLDKEQAKNRRKRHEWDIGMRGSTFPGWKAGRIAVAFLSFGS